MSEMWLEIDTFATWKKLCVALHEIGQSVLAEHIASKNIRIHSQYKIYLTLYSPPTVQSL